ncbi:hypothetical protein VTN77DRAFT_8219 [Rasamsonia byssochlamydoides]|uniref:uncharacterized protein n=1 Tax=Rasamsonia byssochlamydoides TaxID=89139 RepID=UPI003744A5BB
MRRPLPSTSTSTSSMSPSQITIHTALLFDPKLKRFERNISIVVDQDTGLIADVYRRSDFRPPHISPHDIDLRFLVVLPGFVDAHTHIFLHAYSETPALNQMRDESLVERVIRAVNHCRDALLAGYTTYRDLGTEGLQDADVNVRDAVNRGLTPGPRLFVATETIASSGGYAIRQENHLPGVGTSVPSISDVADGIYGVRAAVRRRIGAGADVVKFYADYRKRQLRFPPPQWKGALPIQFPPRDPNPNVPLFTQEEMNAIVAEADVANCPVAAHASSPEAVIMAAKAGVTTIEHGSEPSDEALQAMKEAGTIFVPTLAVLEQMAPHEMGKILAHTKKAWEMGIKLACGGDTGAFAHGDNAREMELMVQAGVPLEEVLTAATLHGWEACGGDRCGRRFGWFERGVAADIIALDGDPRSDLGALRKVQFVMKDGRVWKRDGVAVGMV